MHFDHLKVFCDLVSTQSFSLAAKSNDLTQSAVSQQVKVIERQLGASVVDRSSKQFRLTDEGYKLYEFALDQLKCFAALKNEIAHMQTVVSGSVRISTIVSIGLHELPTYLKRYLRLYPQVEVHIEYRCAALVYEDVLAGRADVGLLAFASDDHKELECVSFREDELVVICHPDHPLAKISEVDPRELSKHRFIAFDKEIPTRKGIDAYFKKHFGSVLQPVMEFDNVEVIKRAVEIDSGIALVPANTIETEVRQKTLASVRLKDHHIIRPLSIVYNKGRLLAPPVERLLAVLTSGKLFPTL